MDKKWWQSKKFWALVVGIVGTLLPVILNDPRWSDKAGEIWKMVVAFLISQGYIDAQTVKQGGQS